jgi:putative flippase GtrA
MRIRAALTRRYTIAQSVAILLPTIVLLLITQTVSYAIWASRPIAAVVGLVVALGSSFTLAALIDRRTRG